MIELSLVIATIDDSIATNLTISQALAQLERDRVSYEIILVDNGSERGELENLWAFLKEHRRYPIRFYSYTKAKGIIPPHSFGVYKARGKYITMPDPHIIFPPHYFRKLLAAIKKYKNKDVEVVFTPFRVESIGNAKDKYIAGSCLILPNPFGKTVGQGEECQKRSRPRFILANSITSFISSKRWFLKIGNMFPDAFKKAGGYAAEGLMIGITTWMFGKKCLVVPSIPVEHPTYRFRYGSGRSANLHLSMAVGSYILGGNEYLSEMPSIYGEYTPGDLEEIPQLAKRAREYIQKNSKMTLRKFMDYWSKIIEGIRYV